MLLFDAENVAKRVMSGHGGQRRLGLPSLAKTSGGKTVKLRKSGLQK